jgi:branched-chain amino acid transport system substrate-binding protein
MNVNALTTVLKKCGDQLTLPGITISTEPGNYTPFKVLRIAKFDGTSWTLSGDPISAE